MSDAPILITGGAGFIGSHLADALLARGRRVRVLDDLSTGKRENLPLDNERIELRVGDVVSVSPRTTSTTRLANRARLRAAWPAELAAPTTYTSSPSHWRASAALAP